MWEFVTAHVHRQLKAVGVQIAEIIHTCQKKKQQHRNMSVGQRRLRSELHPALWQESAALIKREMCSESRFFFWFLVYRPIPPPVGSFTFLHFDSLRHTCS